MNTSRFSMTALGCALLLSPLALADTVNTSPADNVDLSRYLGTWHETARFENLFERGLHAVTALYERMADGRISVTNSGTAADGVRHDVVGVAQPQEDGTAGELEVSFVPPYTGFYSDYRILYVTPDYSGALVSDGDGSMLWLLERDAAGSPEVREILLNEAQKRGFDTSELLFDADMTPDEAAASESEVDAE